jgi:hypothetical protein
LAGPLKQWNTGHRLKKTDEDEVVGMKANLPEIESAIVRRIKPLDSGDEDAVYDYQCPKTGRLFMIRRYGNRYLLEELVPIGIWDRQINNRALESLFETIFARARPNEFKHVLLRRLPEESSVDCPGTSRYLIIRATVGEGQPTFSNALSECARKIADALNTNAYYQAWQPPAEKTGTEAIEKVKEAIFYWQLILKAMDLVEPGTVFKGTFNTQTGKISDQVKQDLLHYFNAPSFELWDRLFCQTIVHNDTLWQAWCDYDPEAPRAVNEEGHRVWPRIPDGDQLREAIRACVQANRERAEAALSRNTALLEKLLNKNRPSLKLVKNLRWGDRVLSH